jgi:hypothetical protein
MEMKGTEDEHFPITIVAWVARSIEDGPTKIVVVWLQ